MSERSRSIWLRYLNDNGIDDLLLSENFRERKIPDDFLTDISIDDYDLAKKIIKRKMQPQCASKLFVRFRNYKSRIKLKKTSLSVKQETRDKLDRLMDKNGFSRQTDEGYDALIEILTSNDKADFFTTFTASERAEIGYSLSAETAINILKQKAPQNILMGLEKIISDAWEQGWEARASNKSRKRSAKTEALAECQLLKTLKRL